MGAAFKLMLDRHSPFTSGAYRPIDIVVPPGTVMSAMPPDGAIMLYWEVSAVLLNAIVRELGKVLGDDAFGGDYGAVCVHNAHGIHNDGTPWQNIGIMGGEHGPWGGDRHHDGDSYTVPYMVNGLDPSTEASELDAPVLLMRKEYVIDSAGAGYNRGGAAVLKDACWETAAEHYNIPIRLKQPTGFGVQGGQDGSTGAVWLFNPDDPVVQGHMIAADDDVYRDSVPIAGVLNQETKNLDPDGEYFYFARQAMWRTEAGAMSRYITNGGGGYGAPFQREPERVLEDVRNGYVSIAGAATDYGVVITGNPLEDPEGLALDLKRTAALRAGG